MNSNNITVEFGGSEFKLIGTAHVSRESIEEVKTIIQELVELLECNTRHFTDIHNHFSRTAFKASIMQLDSHTALETTKRHQKMLTDLNIIDAAAPHTPSRRPQSRPHYRQSAARASSNEGRMMNLLLFLMLANNRRINKAEVANMAYERSEVLNYSLGLHV